MKKSGNLCSAKGCNNRSSVHNPSFFGYLKEENRQVILIKNCSTEHLADSLMKSNASFRVCRVHFENKMFRNPITKSKRFQCSPNIVL